MTSPDFIDLASLKDTWRRGLLALMYHHLGAPPLPHPMRGLYVTPARLRRQITQLQAGQVRFTTLTEWNNLPGADRQVAVTFDDAYRSLLAEGLPVLRECGARAITYVPVELIGKSNRWDAEQGARPEPLMNRAELGEFLREGHEIGSHGLTHADLTSIPRDQARREIFESKARLEDMFGGAVRHFCYPYGRWNEAVRDLVREAGYETACSTDPGYNLPETNRFALRRLLARHRRPWLAALTGH